MSAGAITKRYRERLVSFSGQSAPSSIGPRRWRSRLRSNTHWHRASKRRFGVCGRGAQPLAGRTPARCCRCFPALEKGAGGVRYHAVADQGIPFREIATVIGRHLNVPVVSKTPEEVNEHFGWFAPFAAGGWQPKQRGLIQDIDRPSYFEA